MVAASHFVPEGRRKSEGPKTTKKAGQGRSVVATTRPHTSAGTRLRGCGGFGGGNADHGTDDGGGGGGKVAEEAGTKPSSPWSRDLESLQAETLDVLKRCGVPSSSRGSGSGKRPGLLQRSATLPPLAFSRVGRTTGSSLEGRRQPRGGANSVKGTLAFHQDRSRKVARGPETEGALAEDSRRDLGASADDCGDGVRHANAAIEFQRILRGWLCRRRLRGEKTSTRPKSARNEGCQPPSQEQSHGLDEAVRSSKRMFKEDGTPNSLLRDTVSSALKTSRFDSVSAILTSGRPDVNVCGLDEKENRVGWAKQHAEPTALVGKSIFLQDEGQHMVSTVRLSKSRSGRRKRNNKNGSVPSCSSKLELSDSLAIRDVQYTGFEGFGKIKINQVEDVATEKSMTKEERDNTNRRVCFNCWSAGKGKHCSSHGGTDASENGSTPDDSILLCKNWDRNVMRRRYRAEEIEEVFSKTESSLCYDQAQNEFCTVEEQTHPIYRILSKRIAHANFTRRRKDRVRSWFRSIIELLKVGDVAGYHNEASARILRMKRTLINFNDVQKLSDKVRHGHPRAPVTGTTLAEKMALESIVIERDVASRNGLVKRKLIVAGPLPVPHSLYQPRSYEAPTPKTAYMSAGKGCVEAFDPAATSDAFTQAQMLIECLQTAPEHCNSSADVDHSVNSPPKSLKFATFRRKDTSNSLAVGGLSGEVIVSQLVADFAPPRYGNFICMDKNLVAPKNTPEVTTVFKTIRIEPVNQEYVERDLKHALSTRLPPTIMVVAGLVPEEKHYYGKNRPEQTGEEEDHGFRTSISSPLPTLDNKIDTSTFVPANKVASLNLPAVHPVSTTQVDRSYPFQETTSRVNSLSDFGYLPLSRAHYSSNIPQVFTCMAFQEAGRFMKRSDPLQRLGHLETEVTRSWAFLQNYTVEQFFTDDGVPYWYDRRTGETFWERPLYAEEKVALVEGGVYIGDVDDKRNESTLNRRSQIRSMIFLRRETQDESYSRIKSASRSAPEMKITVEGQNTSQIDAKRPRGKNLKVQRNRHVSREETPAESYLPNESARRSKLQKDQTSFSSKCETNMSQAGVLATKDKGEEVVSTAQEEISLPSEATEEKEVLGGDSTGFNSPEIHDDAEVLVDSITKAIGNAIQQMSKPADMLKLGVGLGMSLGAQGFLNTSCSSLQLAPSNGECKDQNDVFVENKVSEAKDTADVSSSNMQTRWKEPIGLPDPKWEVECNAIVDLEEVAEHDLPADGLEIWERSDHIPADMLQAMSSRRVGKQQTEYLPMEINLPKGKPIGRLKPRSAGDDWQAIGFDPWSAGREPLLTEFISSLTMKKPKSLTRLRPGDIDAAFIDLEDNDGLENESRNAAMQAQDFADMCRFVRHGKYREVEEMLEDPDWPMPVDYTDDAGNTLLMVCCQNGNKRIAKLCLRKGCDINKQNLNGQTALHYAFGYGFSDLGEYLCSKGADSTVKNKEGMTVYEGLSLAQVSAL